MAMHQHTPYPHLTHPPPTSLLALLLLSLCLLSLPSTLALPPLYNSRTNSNRRSHAPNTPPLLPASPATPDAPADAASPVDAQLDLGLAPQSHLQHSTPHMPAMPTTEDVADGRFAPVAGDGGVPLTPEPQPRRIRKQSQDAGLYAQQRRARQQQQTPKQTPDAADDTPSAPNTDSTTPTSDASLSASTTDATSSDCLTAEQLSAAKKEARGALLSVMDKYLAAWQAEEMSEADIDALYEHKKDELKLKLAHKKRQLLARACPDPAAAADKDKGAGGGGRRALLALDDDDWLEQEEDSKVYLIDEGSVASADELSDDTVGAVARIVAGGGAASPARAEEAGEDDDGPRFDASISPFGMPSAFTSLSERDIEAMHAPPPPPPSQPKPRPVSPVAEQHTDDDGEIGFVASISPARYSPAPLDAPPVIVVGQRSQRDMDEDLEEERRKRRERLRTIRNRSSAAAVHSIHSPVGFADPSPPVAHGSLPLSDEQLPPGGFVASISPMAPQRAVVDGEEEGAGEASGFMGTVGSISAPSIKAALDSAHSGAGASVEDRWRREEEEERQAEEGGGVWRSGSRGRLERVFAHGRQE